MQYCGIDCQKTYSIVSINIRGMNLDLRNPVGTFHGPLPTGDRCLLMRSAGCLHSFS